MYGGLGQNHMTPDVAAGLSMKLFFENLFFLQGITPRVFGSDGALWSLANEFWYYILFPLGLSAVVKSKKQKIRGWERVLYAALFMLTAWFVRGGVLGMFPIWLTGTLLCKVPAPRLGKGVRLALMLAYTPVIFVFGKIASLAGSTSVLSVYGDYSFTLITGLFFWVVLGAREPAQHTAGAWVSRELARFSYTLYVVHMPLLLLVTAMVAGDTRWMPDALHVAAGLGILIAVLGYAYGVAWLTEFRTDTWRRWVEARLGMNARRDVSTAVSRS